jgi:hypothetical protein
MLYWYFKTFDIEPSHALGNKFSSTLNQIVLKHNGPVANVTYPTNAKEIYAISLPDIEDYIGHKIPVASYDPADLPQLVKPKRSSRSTERAGGKRRSSGGAKGSSQRRGRPGRS